ncbi:DUF6580 family putative transport protein [Anatilimnocola floriformis]|uniref:DUF6580 family putative transport protein n=1 Tax=Anatilimnocola floriformis TaxID=2948575 RepID=UPI0020C24F75|nr:DUF6580 family putative transport protein [Anatilimnocola floriformis]
MNKRSLAVELLVLAALITLGAGVRIVLGPEMPNFAPIAAISLFAGYFFQRTILALLAPWVSMLASDAVLGGHEWQMMLVVYFMLTLPIAWSLVLRRVLKIERTSSTGSLALSVGALIGCSLVSSVLFFLVTNFAWFPWSDLYPHTVDGLVTSYQRGLPFFRNTLCGDLFFAVGLFGSYALAVSAGWLHETAAEGKAISV